MEYYDLSIPIRVIVSSRPRNNRHIFNRLIRFTIWVDIYQPVCVWNGDKVLAEATHIGIGISFIITSGIGSWLSYCLFMTNPSVSFHIGDITTIRIYTSQRCLLILNTHDWSTSIPLSHCTEVISMGFLISLGYFTLTWRWRRWYQTMWLERHPKNGFRYRLVIQVCLLNLTLILILGFGSATGIGALAL